MVITVAQAAGSPAGQLDTGAGQADTGAGQASRARGWAEGAGRQGKLGAVVQAAGRRG